MKNWEKSCQVLDSRLFHIYFDNKQLQTLILLKILTFGRLRGIFLELFEEMLKFFRSRKSIPFFRRSLKWKKFLTRKNSNTLKIWNRFQNFEILHFSHNKIFNFSFRNQKQFSQLWKKNLINYFIINRVN